MSNSREQNIFSGEAKTESVLSESYATGSLRLSG